MTALIVVVSLLVVASAAVVAFPHVAWRRLTAKRTVIVNLRSGDSFRGVVWAQHGPVLVLKGAEHINGPDGTPVDGEVVIERSEVEFIQLLRG